MGNFLKTLRRAVAPGRSFQEAGQAVQILLWRRPSSPRALGSRSLSKLISLSAPLFNPEIFEFFQFLFLSCVGSFTNTTAHNEFDIKFPAVLSHWLKQTFLLTVWKEKFQKTSNATHTFAKVHQSWAPHEVKCFISLPGSHIHACVTAPSNCTITTTNQLTTAP